MLMVSEGLRHRLATQLDMLSLLVRGRTAEQLARRPAPDKWSTHENLAHLARYQHVFLEERLPRIFDQDRPTLSRYRAEDDPGWPRWHAMSLADTLADLTACRQTLLDRVDACSGDELARVGVHPVFGALSVSDWLEFYLVHEAHHLYLALTRSRS